MGPISPAGEIHPLTVGRGFRVTARGPVADSGGQRFRALPSEPWERLTNFRSLIAGFQFGVMGLSYVVERHVQEGEPLDPAAVARLKLGEVDEAAVVEALGAPRLWLRRRSGSVMAYEARIREDLIVALGVPPGIGNLIPIPGVAQSRFTFAWVESTPYRTVFFFDEAGRLSGVVRGETP